MNFEIVTLKDNKVIMIDQRKLPTEETYVTLETAEQVAESIRNMTVRGAPAIGVSAAMGMAVGALHSTASDFKSFQAQMNDIADMLFKTRPTAVNLAWGLKRMQNFIAAHSELPLNELKQALLTEASVIKDQDIQTNKKMGSYGQELIADGDTILTHCNAGALATAGFGTALGVIYAAKEAGKNIQVIADETRPVLQGARLTAWELQKNDVPVTVITDNMAASIMASGAIQKIVVGADRIAANGDVANKIGTYSVAINAKYHGIPFYVAAPFSTIDSETKTGKDIPIEERDYKEVTHIGSKQLTPDGVKIKNPGFDVTPAELVTGIITEKGVFEGPYQF